MKILWHSPTARSFYADFFVYSSYKKAFERAGHEFRFWDGETFLHDVIAQFHPDLFVTSTHQVYQDRIFPHTLKEDRKNGLKVFVIVTPTVSGEVASSIKENMFGDIYFAYTEPEGMKHFVEQTGAEYHCIPLAADVTTHYPTDEQPELKSDCAYLGNNLPNKKAKFDKLLFPLKSKYGLRVEGTNWSFFDKVHSRLARAIGIPRDLKFPIEQEREIYSSTKIGLNIHEQEQGQEGFDVNERTFKIPACGCLQISDWNNCIRKYFNEDEVIIAKDERDWFDKIEYYLNHEEERKRIAQKALERVKKEHTYDHRVAQMLKIYEGIC